MILLFSFTEQLLLILLLSSFDYSSSCLLHGSDTGICTYEYLPETYGGGREGIEIANKKWDCKDDTCMPFCGRWIGKCISFNYRFIYSSLTKSS